MLLNYKQLNKKELLEVKAGSFGGNVGAAIRFGWINMTSGYASAVADYAMNAVKCK